VVSISQSRDGIKKGFAHWKSAISSGLQRVDGEERCHVEGEGRVLIYLRETGNGNRRDRGQERPEHPWWMLGAKPYAVIGRR
jgi:hypothetical protein